MDLASAVGGMSISGGPPPGARHMMKWREGKAKDRELYPDNCVYACSTMRFFVTLKKVITIGEVIRERERERDGERERERE